VNLQPDQKPKSAWETPQPARGDGLVPVCSARDRATDQAITLERDPFAFPNASGRRDVRFPAVPASMALPVVNDRLKLRENQRFEIAMTV
jgi:hypothetical protein